MRVCMLRILIAYQNEFKFDKTVRFSFTLHNFIKDKKIEKCIYKQVFK